MRATEKDYKAFFDGLIEEGVYGVDEVRERMTEDSQTRRTCLDTMTG